MNKKTIIGVSVYFAIVIAIMLLLIPIENKNLRYKKWGSLAELAETNSMAEFIIENEDLYPERIADMARNAENLEYAYNYAFHKDDYKTMTFTESELNADEIPALYMQDYRWAYEYIYNTTIKQNGCSAVAITMANLYLNHDDSVDPVKFIDKAKEMDAIAFPEGVYILKIEEIIECFNLDAEGVDCKVDYQTGFVEHDVLTSIIDDEEAVLLLAVSSEEFGNHMFVVRDYCDEGYCINDPASPERTEKIWPFEEIEKDISYYWKITKK